MQAPNYERDFYADDFIQDPAPYYAEMRALGPVIWFAASKTALCGGAPC